MSEVTDLVVIEKQNAMAVFTTKEQLEPLLERIEAEARSHVPDVSTLKGRKAIASIANQVARSKTYIDNAGKDLVAELKALPKQIDESRRLVRERLDSLKDEVRRPLTEWEHAEDERKQALQQRLRDLLALANVLDDGGNYLPSKDIQSRLGEAKAVTLDDSWQELAGEAGLAKDATLQKLEAAVIVAMQREHEVAELERLRKEAEEKAQRERDEQLQREAAEKAQREAEARHREEIEAAARREAEVKARAEAAERQRIEAEQRAQREAEEARLRAEREKQAAIAAEQRKAQEEADRIKREAEAKEAARLAEEQRIADETAKREADVKHRKTVGTEIVNALLANTSLTREQAIEVLTALKDGLVPRAKIHY